MQKAIKQIQESCSAQLPSQSAIAELARAAELTSSQMKEQFKSVDWTAMSRLRDELRKTADLSSRVQLQKQLLDLGEWPQQIVSPPKAPPSRLRQELGQLRKELSQQSDALSAAEMDKDERERQVEILTQTLKKLEERERYGFLLAQLHPAAMTLLEDSDDFRDLFLSSSRRAGFVMSVDIRRSTDLMLKAREPGRFADFICRLCGELATVVLDNYGVFDQFTGDGVLAFFPDFYSGPDSGYYAVTAAQTCHDVFSTHYRESRSTFFSVLQDAGLGVGIDYGEFSLVQVPTRITVVGPPVVYACRMAGGPAGHTLLNQPAYEQISERYGAQFSFDETELSLKHDGPTLAYRLRGTGQSYKPSQPDWRKGDDHPQVADTLSHTKEAPPEGTGGASP